MKSRIARDRARGGTAFAIPSYFDLADGRRQSSRNARLLSGRLRLLWHDRVREAAASVTRPP